MMALRIPTFEDIVADLITKLGTNSQGKLTNFNVGSVIRTISEVYGEVAAELYAYAADMLKQGYIDTATGMWLDRKAKEYGITRMPAITAQRSFTISRKIAKTTNVIIPAASLIATKADRLGNIYRFVTVAEAILVSGTTSVSVLAVAEKPGKAYNIDASTPVSFTTFVAGVDALAVGEIAVTGTDKETDAALRSRLLTAFATLATGATAATICGWALAVSGVKSAWVEATQPRGEGTVDLYITEDNGVTDATPSDALIAAVQAYIDARRPICVDILVRRPGTIAFTYSISVTPIKGTKDTAPIESALTDRVKAWHGVNGYAADDITPLNRGADIVLSRLVAIGMATAGVYSFLITRVQTSGDGGETMTDMPTSGVISVGSKQVPTLGGVAFTFTSASRE